MSTNRSSNTSAASGQREPRRRVHHFAMLKQRAQKIVMVTAHDYPGALAADAGGVDAVLVGDSLGMVALGMKETIPVTMDIMVHHCAAVRRGIKRALLVADMPFMSYKVSPEQALENAARLMQEGGAEAVKLEGGAEIVETVRRLTEAGINVMAHIGLTPQSVHQLGGYRVQGRHDESARKLRQDGLALAEAGAFSIVLEAMHPELAAELTQEIPIATIGIGAGAQCDGQILVMSDLLGALPGTPPKFVKPYASLYDASRAAIEAYSAEVRGKEFPTTAHEY